MEELIRKLNYKGFKRIAVLNSEDTFFKNLTEALPGVITDREVDQRCPYMFMMIFVKSAEDIEHYAPIALHNLTADGILWFCYPKKSSKKHTSEITRDSGWEALNNSGFHGIRMVAIDDEWSGLRFRNIKYIKSESARFKKEVKT
jgi:hypothetical protein